MRHTISKRKADLNMRKRSSTIATFLKGHIIGIFIVGILCSLAASYIYKWIQPQHASAPSKHMPPASIPLPIESTDADAPLVTFADGKRAYINFSVVTRIIEEDAARVIVYAGNAQNARTSLEPPTAAAVYALLEKLTYDEARARRLELESMLLNTLIPRYKAAGLTIDSVSLKEIRLLPLQTNIQPKKAMPHSVSRQKIQAMLDEIAGIQRNWAAHWKDVEPLAERARVTIEKQYPDQAAKIAEAQKTYDKVADVAKVLETQLQVVRDQIQ
jgi:hypothetical protein